MAVGIGIVELVIIGGLVLVGIAVVVGVVFVLSNTGKRSDGS